MKECVLTVVSDTLKEQVIKVLQYSQDIPEPQVDDLLQKWCTAKQNFIEAWDGMIYEYPEEVEFALDEYTKNSRINHLIDIVSFNYSNQELADFIDDTRADFFDNHLSKQYICVDGNMIAAGTKIIRAFKHFEKDKKALAQMQDAASRIIQENKLTGKICLSVHPLDYLSVSENASKWCSCHSLDGDYRMGNLNYMVDESTIVCYIKTTDGDRKLPMFPDDVPWNNKKWRTLFYFSTDWTMVAAGRSYPFSCSAAMEFIKDTLFKKANLIGSRYDWSEWQNDLVDHITTKSGAEMPFDVRYVPIGHGLKPIEEVFGKTAGTHLYNDLIYSSCYKPQWIYKRRINPYFRNDTTLFVDMGITTSNTHFNIGQPVPCIRCGSYENKQIPYRMHCVPCEAEYGTEDLDDFFYCACCGQRYFYDDGYNIGDDTICYDCVEDYTMTCEKCGVIEYKEQMTYDRNREMWLCGWCYQPMY